MSDAPQYILPTTGTGTKTTSKSGHELAIQAVVDELYEGISSGLTGLQPKGSWDADSGTFPTSTNSGEFWVVGEEGTVDGVDFSTGDWLIATTDSASTTTYSGNWAIGQYSRVKDKIYKTVESMVDSVETSRGVGYTWVAGGYVYEEADSGATDNDLETAGGVKLYVKGDDVPDAAFFTATNVDDTENLQAYFDWCEENGKPARLVQGRYKVTDTIVSNVRSIDGIANYVDSGNPGTLITFDPTTSTDLKACIQINSGMNQGGVISGVSVFGNQSYSMLDAETWCPNPDDLPSYDAFLEGHAGFEILNNNTPVFRNCKTNNIKIGRLDNNNAGHIMSDNSNWSGWLAGVYCLSSSGDYRFINGSVTGIFAGYLIGCKLKAGHYGGVSADMMGVHMGFSAYGFYQVDDDGVDGAYTVSGLAGNFEIKMEQIGEAAIKLLDYANLGGIDFKGTGFGWSDIYEGWETEAPSGWAHNLHPSIIPYEEQQLYAVRVGYLEQSVAFNQRGERYPFKVSPNNENAQYTVRIAEWQQSLDWDSSDLNGLYPDIDVVSRTGLYQVRAHTMGGAPVVSGDLQVPSAPNLLLNPEDTSNWIYTGTISSVSASTAGELPKQMVDELGSDPVAIKLDAGSGNNMRIPTAADPIEPDGTARYWFSFWIYTGRSQWRFQVGDTGTDYAFPSTATGGYWRKIIVEGWEADEDIHSLRFFSSDDDGYQDVYVAGVMLGVGQPRPYKPSNHFSLTGADSTTTAPSAGAGDALPATPTGYITININGTNRQIAYY